MPNGLRKEFWKNPYWGECNDYSDRPRQEEHRHPADTADGGKRGFTNLCFMFIIQSYCGAQYDQPALFLCSCQSKCTQL